MCTRLGNYVIIALTLTRIFGFEKRLRPKVIMDHIIIGRKNPLIYLKMKSPFTKNSIHDFSKKRFDISADLASTSLKDSYPPFNSKIAPNEILQSNINYAKKNSRDLNNKSGTNTRKTLSRRKRQAMPFRFQRTPSTRNSNQGPPMFGNDRQFNRVSVNRRIFPPNNAMSSTFGNSNRFPQSLRPASRRDDIEITLRSTFPNPRSRSTFEARRRPFNIGQQFGGNRWTGQQMQGLAANQDSFRLPNQLNFRTELTRENFPRETRNPFSRGFQGFDRQISSPVDGSSFNSEHQSFDSDNAGPSFPFERQGSPFNMRRQRLNFDNDYPGRLFEQEGQHQAIGNSRPNFGPGRGLHFGGSSGNNIITPDALRRMVGFEPVRFFPAASRV